MRIFIGFPLPLNIVQGLKSELNHMVPMISKGQFISDYNIHLTLLFIGELNEMEVDLLYDTLLDAFNNYQSFDISYHEIDAFIRQTKHLLYAGIIPSPSLDQLNSCVKTAVIKLNIPYDDKPFFPHVTLLRNGYLRCQFKKIVFSKPYTHKVSEICIYHSHLHQEKLTYTPLKTIALKK